MSSNRLSLDKPIIAIITIGLLWAAPLRAVRQASVDIWASDPRETASVMLTPYIPSGPSRGKTAVIVCPGGSYFWLARQTEGVEVAQWLRSQGIAAFVLEYRTAGLAAFLTGYRYMWDGFSFPDPQDDLMQALSYVRIHADRYGIDPGKVGAMGFSAGGHLVVSVAEMVQELKRVGRAGMETEINLMRPDFVAAVYPVVSMDEDIAHKRSRRALLGERRKNDPVLRHELSLEKHVSADLPPIFLVNCQDDPTVDYRNSVLLDSALTAVGARHEYVRYRTGGHGFGVNERKGTPESRGWKYRFIDWLKHVF